jgi:hypothetical protein
MLNTAAGGMMPKDYIVSTGGWIVMLSYFDLPTVEFEGARFRISHLGSAGCVDSGFPYVNAGGRTLD